MFVILAKVVRITVSTISTSVLLRIYAKIIRIYDKNTRNSVRTYLPLVIPRTPADRLQNNEHIVSAPYSKYAQKCSCRIYHVPGLDKRDLNKLAERYFRVVLA